MDHTLREKHNARKSPTTDGRLSLPAKVTPWPRRALRPVRDCLNGLNHHPTVQKLERYHFGVLCCAAVSAAVLIVNSTLTVWVYKHYGIQGGLRTIRDGSCSRTKDIAVWLHLAINILSTLFLGASSYTMQCLIAPTRQAIDMAHEQKIWLDIGTPSIRNLFRISRSRMLLWWMVVLSSVPLHLMYNSAIFTTLSAREYSASLVTTNFFAGAPFDLGAFVQNAPSDLTVTAQGLQDGRKALQRMDDKECIKT